MNKNLIFSLILHLLVFLFLIFGLNEKRVINDRKDSIILTNVITMSEYTNLKTKLILVKPKIKNDIKLSKNSVKFTKAKEEVKEIVATPKLKKKEVIEDDIKPVVKPKRKIKEIVKEVNKQEFNNVLQTIETYKDEEKNKADITKKFEEIQQLVQDKDDIDFDENLRISISEIDYLRSRISQNWNIAAISGNIDAQKIIVEFIINMKLDGNAASIEHNVISRGEDDASLNAFISSGKRAIYSSTPFSLPIEKYETGWKRIIIEFKLSDLQ